MSIPIQEILTSLLTKDLASFYLVWGGVSLSLIISMLLITSYVVTTERYDKISDKEFFIIGFLVLLVCRLPSLIYGESNPDESQWLATAMTLDADISFYLREFYVYDYGRVLTILPLWALSKLGFTLDYSLSKITGLLCWFVFICFYYRLISDLLGRKTAILSGTMLIIFIATFSHYDHIAYNSETPAVALLSIIAFSFYRSLKQNGYLYATISGMLLPAVCFTKEQALYIALITGIACGLTYIYIKHFKTLCFFVLSGAISSCILLLPIILFADFNYISYLLELANIYHQFGINTNYMSLTEKGLFIFKNEHQTLLLISLVLLIFSLCIKELRAFIFINNRNVLVFVFLFYLVCLYTVITPHNIFSHYLIFLILPSAYLVAIFINGLILLKNKPLLIAVVISCVLFIGVLGVKNLAHEFKILKRVEKSIEPSVFSNEIRKHSKPGDRMLIWGWETKYYIETGLLRGSPYLYTGFLVSTYPYEFKAKVINNYIKYIKKYQPKIIIEVIGKDEFIKDPNIKIKNFPELQGIIDREYNMIYKKDSRKIYVRNSLQKVSLSNI